MISLKQICVALSSLAAVGAIAQEKYHTTIDSNVWLQGDNAASWTTCEDSTVSMANLSWSRTWGSWHDINEGSSENNVEANVASFMRLSPSVMTHGGVRYVNFNGHDMQGSMLYDDGTLKPFDIVDAALTNEGDKRVEIVGLDGAIGWRTMRHLAVGAKADYAAGTYVKYKDLRHTNTYMHLYLTGGICLPQLIGGKIDVGFYGQYRRRSESIVFKIYGTNDVVYKSIVDYANMTGTVEAFGGEGFTESGKELPHLSEKRGGGVQLNVRLTDNVEWFTEALWMTHDGRYGKKSQFSISYAQWAGNELEVRTHVKWTPSRNIHLFDLMVKRETLSAERENYIKEKSEGNASVIYYRYYSPTKMNDKEWATMKVAYTGYFAPISDIYLWTIDAGVELIKQDQTAYVYPNYSSQNISVNRPYVKVTRRVVFDELRYLTTNIAVATSCGSGDIAELGQLAGMGNGQIHMAVQKAYQKQHYEYQTKRQWDCSCGVGYSWRTRRNPNMNPSVSLTYNLCKSAVSESVDGNTRQNIMIRIGLGF